MLNEWDSANNNKLHAIKPNIGPSTRHFNMTRREQVVIDRLRLGHSYLTHIFLLQGNPPTICNRCRCNISIKHVLTECPEYARHRRQFLNSYNTIVDFFKNESKNIILFLRTTGLFYQI